MNVVSSWNHADFVIVFFVPSRTRISTMGKSPSSQTVRIGAMIVTMKKFSMMYVMNTRNT